MRFLKEVLLPMSVAMAVAGSLVGGVFIGAKHAQTTMLAERAAQVERDQKILDFIVKRNPNATIKEFMDLPRHIVAVADQYGIDYRLVMAVIDKESEWNPKAVSPVGAVGLMQIMPATGVLIAKQLGVPFTPPKGKVELGTLGDPKINITFGVVWLSNQVKEFGGVGPVALRSYNRGGSLAREHRPADRYAEDVALNFMTLTTTLPAPPVQAEAPAAVRKPEAKVSPAAAAGEIVAGALAGAMKGRFPSLVEPAEPAVSLPPVFEAEYDRNGIPLPVWKAAR